MDEINRIFCKHRLQPIRFKEHRRNTWNNKEDSKYAQHILNSQHRYGTTEQPIAKTELGKK